MGLSEKLGEKIFDKTWWTREREVIMTRRRFAIYMLIFFLLGRIFIS